MEIDVVLADFNDEAQAEGFVKVLDAYARDPMGGGEPLDVEVRARLPRKLREQASSIVLLAHASGRVAGAAACFLGFSTFAAKPLLNIHDLAVLPEFRGQGVGSALLAAVDAKAKELGCCKVTLEVREDNHGARALYERVGFSDYTQAGKSIRTLFLEKKL